MEIWKDIKEYEGIYQVSTLGNVKSLPRIDSDNNRRKGKILRRNLGGHGYYVVSLSKNCKVSVVCIHRLVAEHFVTNANPTEFVVVNHKDGNKLNNTISNLEWVSHTENHQHAWRIGLMEDARETFRQNFLKNNPKRKYTIEQVNTAIELKNAGNTRKQIATITGINYSTLKTMIFNSGNHSFKLT